MPIEKLLKKEGLSLEAREIWARLSAMQQWALRRDNPLRGDRDRVIYELRHAGKVKIPLISELSGLSIAQVQRISERHPDLLIGEIARLRKAIDRLTKTIKQERRAGKRNKG